MKMSSNERSYIAAASPEDAEAIARLAREIWYLHYPGIITVSQIDYMLAQRYQPATIAAQISANEAWWDKLEVGSRLAGFAGYEPGAAAGAVKLDKLYVHPRVQGCGYGYALVRHVQARSHERGFSSLYLQVNKGNTASIAFYRKAGFAVTDQVKVNIGNGYYMDDFVMSKPLGVTDE
jgi:ribosomal protein S18 acetylase RimI-like enzyme